MNKISSNWCFMVVQFILIVGIFSSAQAGNKFLVVGEEFAPFEFIQDGKVVGIDIDIASHIFKKMNIDAEFKILPWARAWAMVEDGKADAVLTTSRKKKREPYVWYPKENMWISEFVFFVRKDKTQDDFNGYEDAVKQKLKVGIIRGNSYHQSFWAAFPYSDGSTTFQGEESKILNSQLDEAANLKFNLKKLEKGRIAIFPADKVYGAYTVKLLGLQDELTYYDSVLYSKPYPMPFVKNSTYPNIKQVADQFEKELIQLKESGEYNNFFDKWLK